MSDDGMFCPYKKSTKREVSYSWISRTEIMVVWFYSSLEDIGRKPFDVALLERSGKDAWPTIRRPT